MLSPWQLPLVQYLSVWCLFPPHPRVNHFHDVLNLKFHYSILSFQFITNKYQELSALLSMHSTMIARLSHIKMSHANAFRPLNMRLSLLRKKLPECFIIHYMQRTFTIFRFVIVIFVPLHINIWRLFLNRFGPIWTHLLREVFYSIWKTAK